MNMSTSVTESDTSRKEDTNDEVPETTRLSTLDQPPADFIEAHPLKNGWTFWFNQRMAGTRTPETYEKQIKKIGTFKSVRLATLNLTSLTK
jgi:hypothetical protein